MCDRCTELDEAIERYRHVISLITDAETVSEAKKLLEEIIFQKAIMHPDDNRLI